ncbi:hypothetical protein FACS189490_05740 [Clostridia bacterium]|nr:hypothetical protein FACS189490_05740 [Clostridia bacterium]
MRKTIVLTLLFVLFAAFRVSAAGETGITLSHTDYFYDKDINVSIDFSLPGVSKYEICTTSDGTDPVKGKNVYGARPIHITAKDPVKGYVLKVKVFYEQGGKQLESFVVTHTYFCSPSVNSRFSTMIFSVSTDPYNLFDYEYGIFVPGKLRDDFIKANPKKTIDPPDPANFNIRGSEGERPVYVEAISKLGEALFSQGAGVRVHGGWSRAQEQKSMRLIAKKKYEPLLDFGKFHYNIFGSTTIDGVLPIDSYESIVLRNHANDNSFAYMRNEISATLAKKAGFTEAASFAPVSIFLNGAYYGFSWLHETIDPSFLKERYSAPDDNFAVMEFGENTRDCWFNVDEGPASAKADFEEVYKLIREGFEDEATYKKFLERVDIDNLTMYYAMQVYIDNRDWPSGNMKIWKYMGTPQPNTPGLDGKWRFVFYDNEFAYGLYDSVYNRDTIARLLKGGDGGGSKIMNQLFKRDDYRQKFAAQITDLAYGAFSPTSVTSTVNSLDQLSRKELNASLSELSYFHDWSIEQNRQFIKTFAKERPAVMAKAFATNFSFSGKSYTVNVNGTQGLTAKLNTIAMDAGEYKSVKYPEECSSVISASEIGGLYAFDHFLINDTPYYDKTVKLDTKMAKSGKITINLVAKEVRQPSPWIITEVYFSGGADYITIKNTGKTSLSPAGLYLTDDEKAQRYALPAMEVGGNTSVTFYCENAAASAKKTKLVLPFNLSSGETVKLSDKQGNIISQVTLPELPKTMKYLYDMKLGAFKAASLQ